MSSPPTSQRRRPLYFNTTANDWVATPNSDLLDIITFHQGFPGYKPTALVSLPSIAEETGVGAVYVKNESNRCGLPAFKILGAAWGTYRAITKRLHLPLNTTFNAIQQLLSSSPLTLYAATDGNHGRAIARLASLFGIAAEIHVPGSMNQDIIQLIAQEGGTIIVSKKGYDEAVQEAFVASQHSQGLYIQDFSFGDYTEVPQWIVDGYGTMMHEIDQQLPAQSPDLVIAPLGVGSFAQSVVTHYKGPGSSSKVMSVEPDTAACFWKKLVRGEKSSVKSAPTIMAGLDCNTVSERSWPILQNGINVSATVSDFEAHEACESLHRLGVDAGPCGAASLAALRRLTLEDKTRLGLDSSSVVVLLSTEGLRSYDIPFDVRDDDPVALTQALIRIDSANPALGTVPGPGETAIAKFVCSWFEHRDIDAHWIEPVKGRPSVVAVAKGSGGGKRLLLNGHMDTVTLLGYDGNPLEPKLESGKLYGRGSADMKSGLAAQMVAAANSKALHLAGDVIVTAVADEEFESLGTVNVLEAGWRADAAIVSECTNMDITRAHKGFVWFEIVVHGVAAHGSRPDLGYDAISKAGYVLVALDRYATQLQQRDAEPIVGPPSVHASLIQGGEEVSSYPAKCTITLERRTVGEETPASVEQELHDMLEQIAAETVGFKYDLEATFSRPPFHMAEDATLTQLVLKHARNVMHEGVEPKVVGAPFWTDSALLLDAGIPTILFGPRGEGFHAKEEFVYVDSIVQTCDILTGIAREFCA